MKRHASSIDRLLQAVASLPPEPAPEMPFGFDTRVVALWRATLPSDPAAIAHLLRQVILIAVTLIVLAGAGAYGEFSQLDDTDGFALTDAAIGGAFEQ